MKEMKKDNVSFSELVHTLSNVYVSIAVIKLINDIMVEVTNTVIDLIKVIIEDNFNKKEENEREIN